MDIELSATGGEAARIKAETVEAFLRELTALTQRYGVEIGGCGCCGSPFITEFDPLDNNGATINQCRYVYKGQLIFRAADLIGEDD